MNLESWTDSEIRNGLALKEVSESMDPREERNKATGARVNEGADPRTTHFLQGVHRGQTWEGGAGRLAVKENNTRMKSEVSLSGPRVPHPVTW